MSRGRRSPGAADLQCRLTVYVRRGCHLCSDMTQALERLRPVYGFDYREVAVDADPELARQYGQRVPVLTAGNDEICHYFLNERRLVEYLYPQPGGRSGE